MRRRSSAVERVIRPAGRQVVRQRSAGQCTCGRLLLWAETASRDEQLVLVRRELLPQQREVTRPVRHRTQERVDVRGSAGGPEHRVVIPTHTDEPMQARPGKGV